MAQADNLMQAIALALLGLLWPSTTYAAIRIDRRFLRADQLNRAWNAASTGAAVLAFSPFCIIVHSWRTRRGLRGFALGLLWLLPIVAVVFASELLMELLLPESWLPTL